MDMRGYSVIFDERIKQDWMLVEVEGTTVAVFRPSRLSPTVIEEAWAAYRHLAHVGPVVPCQRRALQPV